MPAPNNLIKTTDVTVTAREIDFVQRFTRNWDHLREILGVMRPIRKQPGTVLKSKYAEGTLQSGQVGEGETIPYSHFVVKEKPYAEITVEKYAKAVSLEAIKDHGYENAVQMTDDEFLFQLQSEVTSRFYAYLNTGTLASSETTYQMALAMAKGRVENKFKEMHRTATQVVGFANILDVYEYIGTANITVQNQFGFNYVKDFMGYGTLFLLSEAEIARGRVIATPVENINLYYVDPGDGDFSRANLVYTTDGETSLIGFHTEGKYDNATSVAYAIMGMTLFAEYLDAIAVIDVDATPSLGTLTVTSAAGSATGATKLTVSPAKEKATNVYKYKAGTTAPAVTYGQNLRTWSTWDGESDLTIATGQKVTVAECDSTYKALNAGNATVTAK
nr:MAG TPA: major capsid protein [Caudoviricetes sp.]